MENDAGILSGMEKQKGTPLWPFVSVLSLYLWAGLWVGFTR